MGVKVLLISDLHFGYRGNDDTVLKWQMTFYREIFLPYLDKNNIKDLFILGDLVENDEINSTIILHQLQGLIDLISMQVENVHILVGNHDTPYKNRLNPNISEILCKYMDNVYVYDRNTPITIGNHKISMMPWPVDHNETIKYLMDDDSEYLFGHLEINGFYYNKKTKPVANKFSRQIFNKYKRVFSGHFHDYHEDDNITYVGSPYCLNWNEYGVSKGFVSLDLDTGFYELIENPYNMFQEITYPDTETDFQDKIVRIYVNEDVPKNELDVYIEAIRTDNIKADTIFNVNSLTIDDAELDESVNNTDSELAEVYFSKRTPAHMKDFPKRLFFRLLDKCKSSEVNI